MTHSADAAPHARRASRPRRSGTIVRRISPLRLVAIRLSTTSAASPTAKSHFPSLYSKFSITASAVRNRRNSIKTKDRHAF
jgi:hypothetical protein